MNENLYKKITILVNSCDKYEDIWPIFFKVFSKQFQSLPKFKIVLNTEKKTYIDNNGLNIICPQLYINDNAKHTWSERLIKTLDLIDSEYILFTLEDFFFESPVDETEFERVYRHLENDKTISSFYFCPIIHFDGLEYNDCTYYDRYELIPNNVPYVLNAQVALWRKDKLKKVLRLHEDPWQFEVFGSKRIANTNDKFYAIKYDSKPVFDYNAQRLGIHKNKWENRLISETFFKKLNINVDFEKRGFIESEEFNYSVIKNFPNGILTKKYWSELFNRFLFYLSYIKSK